MYNKDLLSIKSSFERSRVPWGGFANLSGATGNQQFTICRMEAQTNLLPTASTW